MCDHATSTDVGDVEPDDENILEQPLQEIGKYDLAPLSSSVTLSPATAAVSLGLLKVPEVVHFVSSPEWPPSRAILSLDPGCSALEEEVAEETLAATDLRRLFPGLFPDVEGPPPDVVNAEMAVASLIDFPEDLPILTSLAPAILRISTLLIIPEKKCWNCPDPHSCRCHCYYQL